MAIYKLPLDDELDADIIEWIASFPRNKKGEVVRHALRYYMSESKEQEQIFIVSPTVITTKSEVVQKPVEVKEVKQEPKQEENRKPFGDLPPAPRKRKTTLGKGIQDLMDDDSNGDGIPNISMDALK